MSKRRTTKYEHGDRYQVYINRTVDDELLSFINKQSDISGASMLGLIVLYQMYGNTDIDDLLPRNYRVNANIPDLKINVPNTIPTNEVVRVPDTRVVSSDIERDRVKNTGRDDASIAETRPAFQKEVEPTLSEDKKNIETDNLNNKDDIVSPIQNEISNESKEETSNSKGNGLNTIRTGSMMQFGNMMKPNKGK